MIEVLGTGVSGGCTTGIVTKMFSNCLEPVFEGNAQNSIIVTGTFSPLTRDNEFLQGQSWSSHRFAGIICRTAKLPRGFRSYMVIVSGIDPSIFCDDDRVEIDGNAGKVVLPDVEPRDVVTSVLTCRKKILVLRRSQKVGTYRGMWAGVSGHIEDGEKPEKRALTEICEETGIHKRDMKIIAKNGILFTRLDTILWRVHPFLVRSRKQNVTLDWEHTKYMWIPLKMLRRFRTVPNYRAVVRKFAPFILKKTVSTCPNTAR